MYHPHLNPFYFLSSRTLITEELQMNFHTCSFCVSLPKTACWESWGGGANAVWKKENSSTHLLMIRKWTFCLFAIEGQHHTGRVIIRFHCLQCDPKIAIEVVRCSRHISFRAVCCKLIWIICSWRGHDLRDNQRKETTKPKMTPYDAQEKSFDINLVSYCTGNCEILSNVWRLHKTRHGKRLGWRTEKIELSCERPVSRDGDERRYYARKSCFKYGFVTFQYGEGRFHLTNTKVILWQKTRKN